MSKSKIKKIKMISTSGSKHFYTTTKSKNLKLKKLRFKKFDPKVGKHFLYKEKKIN